MAAPVENHTKTGGEVQQYDEKDRAVAGDLDPAVRDIYEQLKIRRAYRFLILAILDDVIRVETAGEREQTFEDFKALLPFSECRYAVFEKEFTTHDGRKASKLFFLTWLPHNSVPHQKMAYTQGKRLIREALDGLFDTQAATPGEVDVAFEFVRAEEEEDDEIDF
mmetsp:Transcript_17855/g.60685  ORF Transcript_17855/g.60685 Transcript_17855/m.60685 type:complete len:165 (-) Transcript_17855:121-615(-)